jgi:hypothetical protein
MQSSTAIKGVPLAFKHVRVARKCSRAVNALVGRRRRDLGQNFVRLPRNFPTTASETAAKNRGFARRTATHSKAQGGNATTISWSASSSADPMQVIAKIVSLIDTVRYRNWPRRLVLYIYALWAASLESSGVCNDWRNDRGWNRFGVEFCADSLAKPVRNDWPKLVLPLGTVCHRVPSPCGA